MVDIGKNIEAKASNKTMTFRELKEFVTFLGNIGMEDDARIFGRVAWSGAIKYLKVVEPKELLRSGMDEEDKTLQEERVPIEEGLLDHYPYGVPYVKDAPLQIPAEPKKVPLVIYVGGERRIIGTATITDNEVASYIDRDDGQELERLIQSGIIGSVSITFKSDGPAIPYELQEFPRVKVKEFIEQHPENFPSTEPPSSQP